jgi:hypothetical protein
MFLNDWENYDENIKNINTIAEYNKNMHNNKLSSLSHIIADFLIQNNETKFWTFENLSNKEIQNAEFLLEDDLIQQNYQSDTFTVAFLFENIYNEYQYSLLSYFNEFKSHYRAIMFCYDDMIVNDDNNYEIVNLSSTSPNPLDKAEIIRKYAINVLVYFEYFGLPNYINQVNKRIYETLAFKPCESQVIVPYNTYTRGGLIFDYVLLDKYLYDESLSRYYKEKLIILQDSIIPTNLNFFKSNKPEKDLKFKIFPKDSFVYANFSDGFKITKDLFDTWLGILKSVPRSVLALKFNSNENCTNLINYTIKHQIDPSRLIFISLSDNSLDCIKYLYFVDLYLDIPNLNGEEYLICCHATNTPILSIRIPEYRGSANFTQSLMASFDLTNNKFYNSYESYQKAAISYFTNKDNHQVKI